MAKARLLRQYLADYNREVQGANKDYKEQYATYQGSVNEYNAFVQRVKVGQDTGLSRMEDGRYAQLGSHEGDFAWSYRDKKGNPTDALSLLGSRAELDAQSPGQMSPNFNSEYGPVWQGNSYWVKNADGTATRYTGTGSTTKVSPEDPGYTQPLPSYGGDSQESMWRLPDGTVTTSDPNVRQQVGWQAGPTLRLMEYSGPDAPTQDVPKEPTFTVNQLEEMANPSNSAAEINRAQAFGYSGKSALVAERDPTKNSAFANLGGDDPNNLKEKGVLARAIAGEI